ncbi:MAG TPA: glycosyltransferase [Cytophagales bacterium]|nr:glycosyltransferase [Cytophagales bacterium]
MITFHNNTISDKSFTTSIIIPTWNNLPFIKLCVDSLKKNSFYAHQIILHINDGSDGTLEWAKANNLDYTHSEENVGICIACNAASSMAATDYIVYLNDDMYACPDWDKYLMDAIQHYGKNDFYFSATMIEPVYSGNKCTAPPFNFGDSPENFQEETLLKRYPEFIRPDWSGSSWPPSIMHKTLWDMVGGFSIEFSPGMYSDPDLSMKLWMTGCRNFRGIGNSLFYHFMSKSTKRIKKNDGRKQFLKKWGISSSLFYKHYLLLGQDYKGLLGKPERNLKYKIGELKCKVKLMLNI